MKYVVCLTWCLLSVQAFAGKVVLTWDPNPPEERVGGYVVYERQNSTYVRLGSVSTNLAALVQVPAGEHCFVVTAVNPGGESVFSKELCATVMAGSLDGPLRLDLVAPSSSVSPLPATNTGPILVRWQGQDDAGGSGVRTYDVFVSENGGGFMPWSLGTTLTEGVYTGLEGNRYAFYCVATDQGGNRQSTPAAPQAQTVVSRNRPPRLDPLALRIAKVGDTLVITNRALDPDLPRQNLQFGLCGGDVTAAHIQPTSGLIVWMPKREEAGRSLRLGVCVSDDGVPSLGATQYVTVQIQDYLEVELGSNVVSGAGTATVPVRVYCSSPLTALEFLVSAPPEDVAGVTFSPEAGRVCEAAVSPEASGRWRIGLTLCTAGALDGGGVLAGQLSLSIRSSDSGFVPLRVGDVMGLRTDSSLVPRAGGRHGRVTVIRSRPLVELVTDQNARRSVVLYGNPGSTYDLDMTTNAVPTGGWTQQWRATLTNTSRSFLIPTPVPPRVFYRGRFVR